MRRTGRDDTAIVYQHNPVRHAERFLGQVGDVNQRDRQLIADAKRRIAVQAEPLWCRPRLTEKSNWWWTKSR